MSEVKSNYFSALAAVDVGKYIEKKGKFSYLSWTFAVDTLRKLHPDATWEVRRFGENQLPYLKTEFGVFVEVLVTVNGITLSQLHPVLDNNNRPIAQPNSFQINTSIQRGLVKSIALHGLGLYIYAGEDLPEVEGEIMGSAALVETPAVPTAREEAIAKAKAKIIAKEANDGLPFETPASAPVVATPSAPVATGDIVEPINEGQIKAISNMLTMIGKKDKNFSDKAFITEAISKYGKTELADITFEQGKEVVTQVNSKMREKITV